MAEFATVIDAATLAANLAAPGWLVIDCRFDLKDPAAGRAAWLDAHIPGAMYADLDSDLAGPVTSHSGRHPLPAVDALIATFSGLGIDGRTQVVAYDDASGAIAARAWWLLRWLGHTRAAVLDGGFAAWRSDERPVEAGAVTVAPRRFRGSVRADAVISTPEVLCALRPESDFQLVDARDPARFRGETEPLDAVAGHIPGAVNLPFAASLDAKGRWRRREELAQLWAEVRQNSRSGNWAVMCGSGVTACHLALSAVAAGIAEPRLYVGSWSEWIRDPARPVATGPG